MARRRTTSFGRTRQVVVIGHNSQVQSTVALFVGGKVTVQVYTADPSLEDRLALYPGVSVRLVETYDRPPPDLPDSAYFLCVDKEEVAKRIRDWLPNTLAVFHLATERRGKNAAPGFLAFTAPQSQIRRRLLKRLSTIRRVDTLLQMARGASYPLILMYGDPDPDAIGAAMAMATIWRQAGVTPHIRYTGEIQRYQNRLLVSYLKEPMDRLRENELESSDLVALVDAQPAFWKHDPPRPHVIIDHHPAGEAPPQAQYLDWRENYGSTVSILLEYLEAANISMPKRLATAMLYGLMTDTGDLKRNVHSADIKAYDTLYPKADQHFLSRLSKSQVPEGMLDHIAWGIQRRIAYRDMLLIHFGEIETPDILVQAADLLLLTCGINWVVCAGKHGDKLVVVFRGDGHRQDVGSRARAAFAKLGSAGGHRTMGRAEIPLYGEHVDATIDILVENLFKRMKSDRQQEFIRSLRNHLHGQGPAAVGGVG